MSIYKPKSSPYFHFDFVRNGRRFHGSTGVTGRRAAQQVEAREKHKAALPAQSRPSITLDESCGLYDEHAAQLASHKLTEYMSAAMITGLGGGRLLSEISQRDLQIYFARRRASFAPQRGTRSNATINREVDHARAIWRRADKARFDVGEMPDWRALRLKVPRRDPRELSFVEEERLFAELAADRPEVSQACDFALKSGWRQAEVTGLRWSDVDLAAGQAATRIKGGDIVKRPLTPTLLGLIANQPKVGPFVFTYVCKKSRGKRREGERYPLTHTVLRQVMASAKKIAGIESFRFHDFRHTRGTRIVRATGSLAAAKEALKHRSVTTTLRYAHVLDDDVRNALEGSDERAIPASASKRKKA
ncbi:site-specific integrase [Sphingomonas kaistensis]|uniref:Site-specific integrase n=1 Tax=Sphingomonas kaistensis TaxID=298708 RepID=A0ABZ2G511_9SPHN